MKAHYQLVINLALVALLLVYAIPMLYAVPTADDYCSGVYQHLGFVEFILYYAKLYTGRLGAVALMYFTPLAGSPVSYSFGLLACWAFLIFSIFLFSYKLFSKPAISTRFALLFSCCYMACLINPSETLYWFTGVATYTVAVSFVFCLLGFMQFKTNVLIALMCMVLGFIIPLFSELFIIPLLFLLCYINIKKAVFSLHLRVNARYALVGLVTGTALFACMPGNWVRLDQYHNNLNLFSAAGTALFYSIIFIFRISFHPVMIISLFLIAIYIDEIKQHTKLREIKGQLPYNGAMFLIFMACFIPAFFTGILGQHRTIDAVIPFVIFLFWYWVFCLAGTDAFIHVKTFLQIRIIRIIAVVLVIAIVSFDVILILNEWISGELSNYKQEQEGRIIKISKANDAHLYAVDSLKHTNTILYKYDIKPGDSTFYINYCMWEYLQQSK